MNTTNSRPSQTHTSSVTKPLAEFSFGYFLRHFACFLATFLGCTFLFYCCFAGLANTFDSVFTESGMWLQTTGYGICVWFVHAMFLLCNGAIRRSGPTLSAIVGSSSVVFSASAFSILSAFGPESVAIPLSRVPEYVLIPIYIAVSIAAVFGIAWATRLSGKDGTEVPSTKIERRRWLQFSLRTLVLLMLAAGPLTYCGFCWGPTLYNQMFPPEDAQTLPTAYYLKDDIQYFPKGPEFKMQTEPQAMRSAQNPVSD